MTDKYTVVVHGKEPASAHDIGIKSISVEDGDIDIEFSNGTSMTRDKGAWESFVVFAA